MRRALRISSTVRFMLNEVPADVYLRAHGRIRLHHHLRYQQSKPSLKIVYAISEVQIAACYPVYKILRPHLREAEFTLRVQRQQSDGFRLIFVAEGESVVAAAGFRILEFLAFGKVLYIDDLVTDPEKRGAGYGGALMDWLHAHARENGCNELHLDSGYQREAAHRLYLNKGMHLCCHHFSMKINKDGGPNQSPRATQGAITTP